METFLLVMQIIALAAVSVLCIYLITVLIRVRSILDIAGRDLKEISAKAIPILENLEVITDKVKIVTETIGEQVESVKHSISSFKEITDNIVTFERRVQQGIEEPVMQTVDTLASIMREIQGFLERIPFFSRSRA